MKFKAGDKVKYRDVVMPAEVLSGPHKSPGGNRWLILKADGNVTLAPERHIERVIPRVDQVAGTLAVLLYGRSWVSLPHTAKLQVTQAAARALIIADLTRGQA